ncbi:MAG: hypothetical protein GQ534_09945, partial [Candidatus Delongbacteria bacterium]|nr:hypothetical protein [Candidatus Delongbacteria bacterium]
MKKFIVLVISMAISLIFAQNPIFETSFETDPFAEGWTLQTTGAGWLNKFYDYTFPEPPTGNRCMAHMDDQGPQDDWIISPVISLPADGNLILSYWETGKWIEYIGIHEVCVTTDNGATWIQINSTVPDGDNFLQVICSLNDYVGNNIQLGWHYTGDYSDQWFIDEILVASDNEAPEISEISAESSFLPLIGTYMNADMEITLELYDEFGIESVVGYYSFDGGITFEQEIFSSIEDPYVWQGVIPAKNEVISGILYFELQDEISNSITSENYDIEFLNDYIEPMINDVQGLYSLVGDQVNIRVLFNDYSEINSALGHYSTDDFITQYNFVLNAEKNTNYIYTGIIPAENEIIANSKIYFTIEDEFGNILTSDNYTIEWLNSFADISEFDLRYTTGSNYVTSVRDQFYGTCWCYAAVVAVESNLMVTGNWNFEGEEGEPNISESHLSWWCGFNEFYNADIDPHTGDGLELHMRGDYLLTTAYMSRGDGFVREIDSSDYYNAPAMSSDSYHKYYARDIEWYTMDDQLKGIAKIKEKIVEHGAIGTSLGYSYSFFDNDMKIFYQPPSSDIYITHCVGIIGWDDNLETQAPEGPGAWLCKNSYDGLYYFWVSYYDKHACREAEGGAVSFQNVERMKYDAVYYHDYHG